MNLDFQLVDMVYILPLWFLLLSSLVPLLVKVTKGNNKEVFPSFTSSFCLVGLTACLVFSLAIYPSSQTGVFIFGQALVLDGFSVWSTVVVSIITICTICVAKENLGFRGEQFTETLFLIMNAALGMLILAWSQDLIITFIGVEILSLCLYLIIALNQEPRLSQEASFKYFVLSSFASAIFLYGVAFIYGATGTTYLNQIAEQGADLISLSRIFLFGVTFVCLGFCFKLGLVPFHSWVPDVYQGACTPVTAFMATGVKVVVFVAFLRLILSDVLMGDRAQVLVIILQWLAVFSIIVGNVAALLQNNLKRILAYSSISHAGYIMIGLIASIGLGGSGIIGAHGVIFYLFLYTFMTLGAFSVVSFLENKEDSSICVDDLKGLRKTHPLLSAGFTLLLLSLAGLPPLAGFFGKFFLFSSAIQQGFFWLALWGVIGSVIGLYYYLRPIVCMYMYEPNSSLMLKAEFYKIRTGFVITLSAVVVIGASFFMKFIYQWLLHATEIYFTSS